MERKLRYKGTETKEREAKCGTRAYGRVSGSISDKDVLADPEKYPGKTRAEEAMLTPDMLTWSLGATIGIKFSKKFAIDKQAQKVSGKNLTVIDDEIAALDALEPEDETPAAEAEE